MRKEEPKEEMDKKKKFKRQRGKRGRRLLIGLFEETLNNGMEKNISKYSSKKLFRNKRHVLEGTD